jgi:hypothetical protein
MSLRSRVLAALVVVLGLGASEWCYLGWPRWFGVEVRIPVTIGRPGSATADATPFYPEFNLRLDAANTTASPQPPRHTTPVRAIGVVWDARLTPLAAVSSLRTRLAYLQLEAGSDGVFRTQSISLTPVPDALNLRVRINDAFTDGSLAVGIDSSARPLPASERGNGSAILRVLPSGRAAMVGMSLADGEHRFSR